MSTAHTHMQGQICLVTGANSGIGQATALALAQMGATVVLVCRDRTKGEATQRAIITASGNTAVDLLQADLAAQASIRQLVAQFTQRYPHLHVLINNAGAAFTGRRETVDGVERTFAVNYLAPFLLTNLLLDALKAGAPARIVNVSSSSQDAGYLALDDLQGERHYSAMRVYGQSKLALVLFTYELARRLAGTGVTANCLHPGFVATQIGQNGAGPVARRLVRLIARFGMRPEEGAQTSLYLAASPAVEGVSGQYWVKRRPRRSAAISYNEALQRQLWAKSVALVNL